MSSQLNRVLTTSVFPNRDLLRNRSMNFHFVWWCSVGPANYQHATMTCWVSGRRSPLIMLLRVDKKIFLFTATNTVTDVLVTALAWIRYSGKQHALVTMSKSASVKGSSGCILRSRVVKFSLTVAKHKHAPPKEDVEVDFISNRRPVLCYKLLFDSDSPISVAQDCYQGHV